MKKLLEISLGIVTSIGGFLEAGSLATAVQAGAAFQFDLIWSKKRECVATTNSIESSFERFKLFSNRGI